MSNNTSLTKPQQKVSVASLSQDLGLAQKIDNLNVLLNTPPPPAWLKKNKGLDYLPIDRVKNNLVTIFQDYDWEIQHVQVIANSIVVTGNLKDKPDYYWQCLGYLLITGRQWIDFVSFHMAYEAKHQLVRKRIKREDVQADLEKLDNKIHKAITEFKNLIEKLK